MSDAPDALEYALAWVALGVVAWVGAFGLLAVVAV
jgi:hypothetical protein